MVELFEDSITNILKLIGEQLDAAERKNIKIDVSHWPVRDALLLTPRRKYIWSEDMEIRNI
jgi:hypothetical protein